MADGEGDVGDAMPAAAALAPTSPPSVSEGAKVAPQDASGEVPHGGGVKVIVLGGAAVHLDALSKAVETRPWENGWIDELPVMVVKSSDFKTGDLAAVPELRGQRGRLMQFTDQFEAAVDWDLFGARFDRWVAEFQEELVRGEFTRPDGTVYTNGVVVVLDHRALSRPGGWPPNTLTASFSASQDQLFRHCVQEGYTFDDFNTVVWPQHCGRCVRELQAETPPDIILECDVSCDNAVHTVDTAIKAALAGVAVDPANLGTHTPLDEALSRVTGSNRTAKKSKRDHDVSERAVWSEMGEAALKTFTRLQPALLEGDDAAFIEFALAYEKTMILGTDKERSVWRSTLNQKSGKLPPEVEVVGTPVVGLLVAKCRALVNAAAAAAAAGDREAMRHHNTILTKVFDTMLSLAKYYPVQYSVISHPAIRGLIYQLLDAERTPIDAVAMLQAAEKDRVQEDVDMRQSIHLPQALGLQMLGQMCSTRTNGSATMIQVLMETDQRRRKDGLAPIGLMAIDAILSMLGPAELLVSVRVSSSNGCHTVRLGSVLISEGSSHAFSVTQLNRHTGQVLGVPTHASEASVDDFTAALNDVPDGTVVAVTVQLDALDDRDLLVTALQRELGVDVTGVDGTNIVVLGCKRSAVPFAVGTAAQDDTAVVKRQLHELLPETSDISQNVNTLWSRYSSHVRDTIGYSIRSSVGKHIPALFKGFAGHVKHITIEHVRRMWCLASLFAKQLHRPEYTAGLLTILTHVLVYGSPEVAQWIVQRRDAVQLACDCAQELRGGDGYFTDDFDAERVQVCVTEFLLRCLDAFTNRPNGNNDDDDDKGDGSNIGNAEGDADPQMQAQSAGEPAAAPDGDGQEARDNANDGSAQGGPLHTKNLLESTYSLLLALRKQKESSVTDSVWRSEIDRVGLQRRNAELEAAVLRRDGELEGAKRELELKETLKVEKERLEDEIKDIRVKFEQLGAAHDQLKQSGGVVTAAEPAAAEAAPERRSVVNVKTQDHRNRLLAAADPSDVSAEDARRFIDDIRDERMESSKHVGKLGSEARMMNGALEHLGESLYSSPLHFFNEILQNAEDNTYQPRAAPELQLLFIEHEGVDGDDCLIVSNNERGFLPKEVLSISSIASSSKQGGKFIGQKGLGFKSVFSITSEPHVHSGNFCFSFGGPGAANSIEKYITPRNINPEVLLEKYPCKKDLLTTSLYLPLKAGVPDDFYHRLVSEVIDPMVLTTSNKIKRLTVARAAKQSETQFTCRRAEPVQPEASLRIFEGASELNIPECCLVPELCADVELEVQTSGAQVQTDLYRVYHCDFGVPRDRADTARPDAKHTHVRFVFPIGTEAPARSSFPVFAALPVMDVGLPFVLDADWVLVTSRASVKESSRWNTWIRQCAASIFAYLFLHDPFIQTHMERFRVQKVDRMPVWWQAFVSDVNDTIMKSYGANARLQSAVMEDLDITAADLAEYANIKVIPATGELFETLLSTGMKPVTICDVVRCFGSGDTNAFDAWCSKQCATWWEQFFNHCRNCNAFDFDMLALLCREKALYLIRPSVGTMQRRHRNFLKSSTPGVLDSGWFRCSDPNLRSWRPDCWRVVDAGSEAEDEFLNTTLQLPQLTKDLIIYSILSLHSQLAQDIDSKLGDGSVEQVHRDLDFLRQNLDVLDRMHDEVSQLGEEGSAVVKNWHRVVVAPSMSDARQLVPLCAAEIPLAFGIPLSRDVFAQGASVALLPKTADFFDRLIWERFLRRVNLEGAVGLINGVADALKGHLIPAFGEWPKRMVAVGMDVLDNLPSQLRDALRDVHMLCRVRSGGEKDDLSCAVGAALDQTTFASALDHLPSELGVDVPLNCVELARCLGVAVDKTADACLSRIIRRLARAAVFSEAPYLEWLWACAADVRRLDLSDGGSFSDVKIFLPDDHCFAEIGQILVTDAQNEPDDSFFQNVCCTLGRAHVSPRRNSAYVASKATLLALGAQETLTFEMYACAVRRIVDRELSPSSYCQELGAALILTDDARETLMQIYARMEGILRDALYGTSSGKETAIAVLERPPWIPIDARSRRALSSAVEWSGLARDDRFRALTDDFPVLLADSSLGDASRVVLCDERSLGSALRAASRSTSVGFSELTWQCPVLCSLICTALHRERPFLDPYCVMAWEPSMTSNEDQLHFLSNSVAKLLQKLAPAGPTIQIDIITCTFMSLTLNILHKPLDDFDHGEEKSVYMDGNHECDVSTATEPDFVIWEKGGAIRLLCVRKVRKAFPSHRAYLENMAAVVSLAITQLLALKAKIPVSEAQRHALKLVGAEGALTSVESKFRKGKEVYVSLANVWFPIAAIDRSVYSELRHDLEEVEIVAPHHQEGDEPEPTVDNGVVADDGQNGDFLDGNSVQRPPLRQRPPRPERTVGPIQERLCAINTVYEEVARAQLEEAGLQAPAERQYDAPPVVGLQPFRGEVDMARQERIGRLGELYFHNYLKHKFGAQYKPLEHWISSNRPKCLENQSRAYVDDGAGFDFVISDGIGFFVRQGKGEEVLCHIEVKSCSGEFDGSFHVSDNELQCCRRISGMAKCAYILAFVEFAGSPAAQLAQLRVWSSNLRGVRLEPQTFYASLGAPQPNADEVDYTSIIAGKETAGVWQAKPANRRKTRIADLEAGDALWARALPAERGSPWVNVIVDQLDKRDERVGLKREQNFDAEDRERDFRRGHRLLIAFERIAPNGRPLFTAKRQHFLAIENKLRTFEELKARNLELEAEQAQSRAAADEVVRLRHSLQALHTAKDAAVADATRKLDECEKIAKKAQARTAQLEAQLAQLKSQSTKRSKGKGGGRQGNQSGRNNGEGDAAAPSPAAAAAAKAAQAAGENVGEGAAAAAAAPPDALPQQTPKKPKRQHKGHGGGRGRGGRGGGGRGRGRGRSRGRGDGGGGRN